MHVILQLRIALWLLLTAAYAKSVVREESPQTVEDQEIINSYGGLDNTPSYLVRLRPTLTINKERIIVAKDGLPMGEDYNLIIDLISPNGTESITNTHIVGNLSVVGIAAGKVVQSPESSVQSDKDAERLLYEAANRYIDRWNKAEDELASLFHLSIARPLPTVVTLGGMIDVTYLLDMPHGFEWKGVYVDADVRAVEAVDSRQNTVGSIQDTAGRKKLFMQLSSLQGSILENRIFEDDFQVASISTAKLFQLATSQLATSIVTIDSSNVNTILPSLPFDQNIKDDIINSVNQNFTIKIPDHELTYENWSGVGYIKENSETGESGWMLSGMIAGGMTAVKKEQWIKQDIAMELSLPFTPGINQDPNAVVSIVRINRAATDYQRGTAGEALTAPFEVMARDSAGKAVKGVPVTFKVIAGGGTLEGPRGNLDAWITGPEIMVKTGPNGVAWAVLTLGQKTTDSPYYIASTPNWILAGMNLVSVSAITGSGTIYTDKPFEAYGLPGPAVRIDKAYGDSTQTEKVYSNPNTFSGTIVAKPVDRYGNPVSNKTVTFRVVDPPTFLGTSPTGVVKNARLFGAVEDCPGVATLDCANTYPKTLPNGAIEQLKKTTDSSGALAYVILGNTDNTKYTIRATTQGIDIEDRPTTIQADFTHYTWPMQRIGNRMTDPFLRLVSVFTVDEKGNLIDAGAPGTTFVNPLTAVMTYTEEDHTVASCGTNCYYLKGKGTFTTITINNGNVDFSVIQGGGSINPATRTQGTEGSYSTTLTLGNTPALNVVKATGTVIFPVPVVNTSTGAETTTDKTLSASTAFEIWAVKATVEANNLMLINAEGYPTADTSIKYKVEPLEYKYLPQNLYLDFYENSAWMGLLQADSTGNLILNAGGAKFNPASAYFAQLVLNRGSKIEITSKKAALPIGQIRMITDDGTQTPVVGAVTDGVTKLRLQLTVKNGRQALPDLTWQIVDGTLPSNAVGRGTLLDGQANPADALPVVFNSNGVAEAVYRVPETFVRFGAGQEVEAQDRERPERGIQVKLNEQTAGLPIIHLKRPPVVLVHGLWGSGDRKNKKNYTWKYFEPLINGKKLLHVLNVNYEKTNTGHLANNAEFIELAIDDAIGMLSANGFAAMKVNIISHSMGGVITREYCRNNVDSCKTKIHKFVTIDTPHLGSELANLINLINQQPGTTCYSMLPLIELSGRRIWLEGSNRATLQGAFIDLSVGSEALQKLADTQMPLTWNAIIGNAQTRTGYAYNRGLNGLWSLLMWHCDRVPDPSFVFYSSHFQAVFSGANDRIVSTPSQQGPADHHVEILDVDHISVLQNPEAAQTVRNILDEP